MIAAMIDGVWLRAALSDWKEADSESARALLTAFVTGRLKESAHLDGLVAAGDQSATTVSQPRSLGKSATFATLNPATGEVLAHIEVAGPAAVDAGGCQGSCCSEEVGGPHRHRARPDSAAGPPIFCVPVTPSWRNSRHAIPASRSRRRASSTSFRAPTASSITRVSRQQSRASISTSGPRRSVIRGVSRWASSPVSGPGTTRCRSRVGRPRRHWPAATR